MIPAPKADVIVPWERHLESVEECLESVLEYGGPALRRLFVVAAFLPEEKTPRPSSHWHPAIRAWRSSGALQRRDSRVAATSHSPTAPATPCSYAPFAWSQEIGSASWPQWLIRKSGRPARRRSRTMAEAVPCPRYARDIPRDVPDAALVRRACAGLPRWTVAPVLSASCIYLRGDVIDAVGLLDAGLSLPDAAVADWVLRAQSLGFAAKRSNHAYIHRIGLARDGHHPAIDLDAGVAELEHGRHLKRQLSGFRQSLDGHLAAHAVQLDTTDRIRVALDLRHLPREQTGTWTYATCLAKALAGLREIDLTLLVRDRATAAGLSGRVVTVEEWARRRPDHSQTGAGHRDIGIEAAFRIVGRTWSSRIKISSDIRFPLVFPNDTGFDRYRATSSLVLPAVQRIVAYSENAGSEISAEFGIPREDVAVVPLGVDARWFSHTDAGDAAVARRLRLPGRYFFSLATDFPHKNLPNILEAYGILRTRWRNGEPPALVLAGYANGGRSRLYPDLISKPLVKGLTFLGPLGRDDLRVLYQHARGARFPVTVRGIRAASAGGHGGGHAGHRHADLGGSRGGGRLRALPRWALTGESGSEHGAPGDR